MNWRLTCTFLIECAVFAVGSRANGADDIHQAVVKGDSQLVKSLVAQDRAALLIQDENGKSPLVVAAELGFREIAELLVSGGADVNLSDKKNWSALHYAAANGDVEVSTLLLESGATTINDTTQSERDGFVGRWTPLHLAVQKGHPYVVRLLLEHGANIEARDGVQRTPLILAGEGKSLEVAEILLEKGADINAEAVRGYTGILWGARNQFEDYVDLLVAAKARIAPETLPRALEVAVIGGMEKLYQYVLELGCNMEEVKARDPGLIFPAATGGSAAIVKSLVELGFDPVQEDPYGYTTVHGAAMEGRIEVLEYLHSLGMDINAKNLKGESAYNAAAASGQKAAMEFLATCGVDTSAPHYPVLTGPYMGQEPPGDVPRMFLPGIVSGHYRAHTALTFSPDGLEAYWTEMRQGEGAVLYSQVQDGMWTYPVIAPVDRDPLFAPDGKRLYFIKTRPYQEGDVRGGDTDFKEEYWYLEKSDAGWSAPISVGEDVNAIGLHWPCSVDRNGNLYFSEFSDNMYFSQYSDGKYQKPVKLTEAFGNNALIGSCPFISPEADYLLFVARDGLNICFKKDNDIWTDGISLGSDINASHVNGSPRVTADGKYMFFVSAGQGRPWGIYWVSAEFIERLRREHVSGD